MRILIRGPQKLALPQNTEPHEVQFVPYEEHCRVGTLAEVLDECPPGWRPDVYYHCGLAGNPLPADIDAFEGLTVTDTEGWRHGGRALVPGLDFFQLVFADAVGYALWHAEDPRVQQVCFGGVSYQDIPELYQGFREIAVLYIGPLANQPWLEGLTRLSDKRKVVLTSGNGPYPNQWYLQNSRIVVRPPVSEDTLDTAFLGCLSGALLLCHVEDAEAEAVFATGVHMVQYDDGTLNDQIAYYLEHDAERAQIVSAARELVRAEHTVEKHWQQRFAHMERYLAAPPARPWETLPTEVRATRKVRQIYGAGNPAEAETALALQTEDPSFPLAAQAALLGWSALALSGREKIRRLTDAIITAQKAARAEELDPYAHMTLGFLLLERVQLTNGAHPAGRNDIIEAAVALSIAAEQWQQQLLQTNYPGHEDLSLFYAPRETYPRADIEPLVYPHWGDAFDQRLDALSPLLWLDELEWNRERDATCARHCRKILSDLALANDQPEEAFRQAEAATLIGRVPPEAWLHLAHTEATLGRLESSVEHYLRGLAGDPLPVSAAPWAELTTVLQALGRTEEADALMQGHVHILEAIPEHAPSAQAFKSINALNTDRSM